MKKTLARGSVMNNSATGTRTRVARVRAEYPNQLDYSGSAKMHDLECYRAHARIGQAPSFHAGGDWKWLNTRHQCVLPHKHPCEKSSPPSGPQHGRQQRRVPSCRPQMAEKNKERNTYGAGTKTEEKVLRGFEPRSLDSESRVLTVTPPIGV